MPLKRQHVTLQLKSEKKQHVTYYHPFSGFELRISKKNLEKIVGTYPPQVFITVSSISDE